MTAVQDMTGFEALILDMQGETFAVDAVHVSEILDMVPVTEVPNSQRFANGLINVRGRVVPLADLRVKFGMEQTEPTIDTRIVVVDVDFNGVPTTVGILADKVYEVTELTTASLTETPKVGMRWRPEFIRCIARHRDDFIIVLNLPEILTSGLANVPADPPTDSAAA